MYNEYLIMQRRQREIQRFYRLGKFLEIIQHLLVLGIFLLLYSSVQMYCAG